MTPVFWPRAYANRLFIVLLVALIYGLLVSVKAQHVFLQGGAPNLDSLAPPWFQFGISILVSLIFLAVGALVWLYASERSVALRSEERRVGKECRYRLAPEPLHQ